MNNQIIQVVESSARHQWFEDLVAEIQSNQMNQVVVTLGTHGALHRVLKEKGISAYGRKSVLKWLNIIFAAISIVRLTKKTEKSLVLAQGHLPSISAWLSYLLCKIDYGIIHHQSPIVFFNLYRSRYPVKGTVQRFFYLHYVKKARFIQVLSMEVYRSLIAIGYPEEKLVLIGHGIKLNAFEKRDRADDLKQKSPNSRPTILMVGRLAWEKNYAFAIQVVCNLVKKQPDLRVVIAGTGPDQDELQRQIADLNLSEHVELRGWVSNISALMKDADVFLHLSITESYGQVLLEACVSELHVFSFPVGIAQDLNIQANPFMHLLNVRSSEAIAEQLDDFLTNRERTNLKTKVNLSNYKNQDIGYVHSAMSEYLMDKYRN